MIMFVQACLEGEQSSFHSEEDCHQQEKLAVFNTRKTDLSL